MKHICRNTKQVINIVRYVIKINVTTALDWYELLNFEEDAILVGKLLRTMYDLSHYVDLKITKCGRVYYV